MPFLVSEPHFTPELFTQLPLHSPECSFINSNGVWAEREGNCTVHLLVEWEQSVPVSVLCRIMWQCTFDMDKSWIQGTLLGRLIVEEEILPVKLLLQNTLNILEPAKRVRVVQCLAFWGHSGFRSMTMYSERGITITGKPSPRSACRQHKHGVFSLVRMAFVLTLVQPYQNLQCLFIWAEKRPPSYCDRTVVSSHHPSKTILHAN